MPPTSDHSDELSALVLQIILRSSESDYVDQLVQLIQNDRYSDSASRLIRILDRFSATCAGKIESVCSANYLDFVSAVNAVLRVRNSTASLAEEILNLSRSIQGSVDELSSQKRSLVNARRVRQNIDDASSAISACLHVLRQSFRVHQLASQKKHFAALRALDDLQSIHLRDISRYSIASMLDKSVPATQKLIADAVMSDLNTWLFRIREASQYLGEVAFYHTRERRERLKKRAEADTFLGKFPINSAVELVANELDEFDILHNEETQTNVDFSPLHEAIHIYTTLGRINQFRDEYAATRRRQKDLLAPVSLNLLDPDQSDLSSLLESIAGFAIVERATMRSTEHLRTPADVDELWESMCQTAISLISSNLNSVTKDEDLYKIKGRLSLFMQTMETWGYSTSLSDSLVLRLFERYSDILKTKFGEDFEEIVSTDDYMPMAVNTMEEYEKVVQVSWYNPTQEADEIQFPCVFPFSQMYPLCCIDIRNFLNQIFLFLDDQLQRNQLIDETIRNALDELLCDKVYQLLIERLSSQYPGQIVQILTNFKHFEMACTELETLLVEARFAPSPAGSSYKFRAVEKFASGRKLAERRVFELVNSKINDLIGTSEYNCWYYRGMGLAMEYRNSKMASQEPSNYMQELTRYISVSMSSALLGLPCETKRLIYKDALSHAANLILSLPLDQTVSRISREAVETLATDVKYFGNFVEALDVELGRESKTDKKSPDESEAGRETEDLIDCLAELNQTVELLKAPDPDEFYDVSRRHERFSRVGRENGAILLEKYVKIFKHQLYHEYKMSPISRIC